MSRPEQQEGLALSEVLAALSYALDLTEGQVLGHSSRSCLIGMRVGREINLPDETLSCLFYALLLKDAGCSSNAARVCTLFGADDFALKRELKLTDWPSYFESALYALKNVAPSAPLLERTAKLFKLGMKGQTEARELTKIRCERGADIARTMGFPNETADAIRSLDEHRDGRGHPDGLGGDRIPLLARIACLAQTVEIFVTTTDIEGGLAMATERSGTWFDPELVAVLESLRDDETFWSELARQDLPEAIAALEPPDRIVVADDDWLDRVAHAFAQVIDAKSPWTYRHSERVAEITMGVADVLSFDEAERRDLERAALLHDIGKLGVSNLILDKPSALTNEEFDVVRKHPEYTFNILDLVAPFRSIAAPAAAHHEKLDGSGYHRQLAGDEINRLARILAVADIFEALSAKRPYGEPLDTDTALDQMRTEVDKQLCSEAFGALETSVGG